MRSLPMPKKCSKVLQKVLYLTFLKSSQYKTHFTMPRLVNERSWIKKMKKRKRRKISTINILLATETALLKYLMRKFLRNILYLKQEQQMQAVLYRKTASRFFPRNSKIKPSRSILENIQHSDNRFLNHSKPS